MNSFKLNYMSAAVNGGRNTLDWNGQLDLIAYAACKRIVIYDSKDYCIVGSSVECHSSTITSLAWVTSPYKTERGTLISSSIDGAAKLWLISDEDFGEKGNVKIEIRVHLLVCLEGHNGSLSSCSAIYMPSKSSDAGSIFTVTMGEDHILKAWVVDAESGEYEEYCKYSLKGRSLAISSHLLSNLPISYSADGIIYQEYPLLLLGGDDGKIHIFAFVKNNCEFIASLSGHQGWVTSLDSFQDFTLSSGVVKINMASGSEDGAVRIWQIVNELEECPNGFLNTKSTCLNIPKCCRAESLKEISTSKLLRCNRMFCTLQSVLLGHEGLISKVQWAKLKNDDSPSSFKLLTCSQTEDRSIIIWKEDFADCKDDEDMINSKQSIWVEDARFGEVGGNREGFFNASFGPHTDKILASSYQGGLHFWVLEDGNWNAKPAVNGHFREVVDLCWGPDASYLLTVSKDQTTRMHSRVKERGKFSWFETSRPQVHGYDMSCISSLGWFRFASAGEEKVIRGFQAPISVIKTYQFLSGDDCSDVSSNLDLPNLASVPSLGLSNKGIEDNPSNDVVMPEMPNESKLMLGTLWPEISKLYGHGNDIISMAANSDGTLLATSCKATSPKDSTILIFDTSSWKLKVSLEYHRLTVTDMTFSPCNTYILSVSRDRSWAIFKKEGEGYKFHSSSSSLPKNEQHSRVIWSVCWLNNASNKFVSASRDKSVVVWSPVYQDIQENDKIGDSCENELMSDYFDKSISGWKRESISMENDEVTAVDSFLLNEEIVLIAIGTLTGDILIRSYNMSTKSFNFMKNLSPAHHDTVRRLAFKLNKENILMLASCGNDNTTFIYEINYLN